MRVAMFSTKPYDRRSFEARNGPFGHRLHYREPRLDAETALAGGRLSRRLPVRQRSLRCRGAGDPGRRGHAAGGAALRRVQQCRPRRRGRSRHPRRARAGLLAARRGRVHGRPHPDPEPADPSRLQPHARKQFRSRRPARLRSLRQDRGRDRHRQDRRLGRELPAAGLRLRGAGPRYRREPRARSPGRALPAAGRARGARRHPHPPLPADPGRPGIWSARACSSWSSPA